MTLSFSGIIGESLIERYLLSAKIYLILSLHVLISTFLPINKFKMSTSVIEELKHNFFKSSGINFSVALKLLELINSAYDG